jgi:hypothetical protein
MDPNNEPPKVVFEEENQWKVIKHYPKPLAPKMVRWVMKHSGGLIKDENQASYVLVVFAIIIFVISLYFFFGGGTPQPKVPVNVLQQIGQIPGVTSR